MKGSLTLDQALEKARQFRREQGWSQIGCSSSSEEREGPGFVFGLEIDHGRFPNGGEIRWTQCLTEDIQPSRCSEARCCAEFDRDTRIIHQETSEPGGVR